MSREQKHIRAIFLLKTQIFYSDLRLIAQNCLNVNILSCVQ